MRKSYMKFIAIPSNVYFRFYGENAYLFNRRNWASALVREVGAFRLFFMRHPVEVEPAIHRIALKHELLDATVEMDFHEVFDLLIADGYFVTGDQMGLVETYVGEEATSTCVRENSDSIRMHRVTSAASNDEDSYEDALGELSEYFASHPAPFELCIDLTQACTERCVHCYVPDHDVCHLPKEDVFRVLDQFAAMGGLKVKLTGGECMLHPDFKAVLDYAARSDLVISVLSNLTCCDDEMAAALCDTGVAVVQTSLYGMTDAVHDSVTRRRGSLRETLAGIDRLLSVGVPVQVNCPVMRLNKDEIPALMDFGNRKRIKVTFDASLIARADHSEANRDCALSEDELRRYLELYDCPDAVPDDSGVCIDCDARVCEVGTMKISLASNGDYFPCNGCHGYVLGNCKMQTLDEVWKGEKMEALRRIRFMDMRKCRACENIAFCKVCPMRNFNATGKLTIPDPSLCRIAAVRREVAETKKGLI